jgi:hypothetical protein
MWDMGCYEISLGDTIGVGTPGTALPLKNEAWKEMIASSNLCLLQDPLLRSGLSLISLCLAAL